MEHKHISEHIKDGQTEILRITALNNCNTKRYEELEIKWRESFKRIGESYANYGEKMDAFMESIKTNDVLFDIFLDLEAAINIYHAYVSDEYYAQGLIDGYFLGKETKKYE